LNKPEGLLTVDDALKLTRQEVIDKHKKYINASLVNIMSLVGFTRQFVRGDGLYIWDEDGNKYLDLVGGYGSLNLGHNHPKVLEAVNKVSRLPNFLQCTLRVMPGVLAENLAKITPGNLQRSFFCNSGAEAVEGALKLARAATGRKKIVSNLDSFHGKSLGALSATGKPKYQKLFHPLLPEFDYVPFDNLNALESVLQHNDVAAFIFEPIQGEAGIQVPAPGYLRGVRHICDKYNTLLIADEIQTGLGRTGKMFACEHEGVAPDILTLAKALSGGVFPIGAFVTTDEIWQKAYGTIEKATLHTSTFGGGNMACAAAIQTIETLYEENLPENAAEVGEYFIARLQELQQRFSVIKAVRGRGLMIGLEFNQATSGLLEKISGGLINKLSEEYLGAMVAGQLLNNHGILTIYTLNNPNVIRIEPALNFSRENADTVVNALEDIFKKNNSFFKVAFSTGKDLVGNLLSR
jgi:putrescine aminotransferase